MPRLGGQVPHPRGVPERHAGGQPDGTLPQPARARPLAVRRVPLRHRVGRVPGQAGAAAAPRAGQGPRDRLRRQGHLQRDVSLRVARARRAGRRQLQVLPPLEPAVAPGDVPGRHQAHPPRPRALPRRGACDRGVHGRPRRDRDHRPVRGELVPAAAPPHRQPTRRLQLPEAARHPGHAAAAPPDDGLAQRVHLKGVRRARADLGAGGGARRRRHHKSHEGRRQRRGGRLVVA